MKFDEWCESCKEYDQEAHCCPRFNKVIRETLDDVRKDAYRHGVSKGIKKGRAMARSRRMKGKWIDTRYDDVQVGRAGTHECFCSRCGAVGFRFYKYCPECGAKMEEGYERKDSNY